MPRPPTPIPPLVMLTEQELHDVLARSPWQPGLKDSHRMVAAVQLRKVLDARVPCPRCDGAGSVLWDRDCGTIVGCTVCGGKDVTEVDQFKELPPGERGTGTVRIADLFPPQKGAGDDRVRPPQ